jgi:hypothetical protein
MNAACSAGLFYAQLAKHDYNNTANSPGSYAQAVQGSAFPDRYDQRYGEAEQIYNRLLGLIPGPLQPPQQPGEDMALVPQDQWDAMYRAVMNQRRSRSPLRDLDEGNVGDTPDQIWDMDSSIHILVVYLMATLGNPSQLALLNRVASADPVRYPDRQADRQVAQAILAEVAENTVLKNNILALLGRVVTVAGQPAQPAAPAPPAVLVPEVLPAVRPTPLPVQQSSTDDLLTTLDRLRVFDDAYRQKFTELTKEP